MQGHGGTGLSPRGRAEAEATAEFLAREYQDVALLLRSDLQRVAETAAPTEVLFDVHVDIDERLREIDVGTWSGLTYAEIEVRDPEGLAAWRCRGDQDVRRGGGETFAELRERVWPALREATDHEGTVLVFTHGGPIRVAVAAALGLPATAVRLASVDNCSLTLLDWRDDQPRLRAYNRIGHLRSCQQGDIRRQTPNSSHGVTR